MTLETSARVAAWIEGRARPPEARNARHHVLRRRAAPESPGDVRHGRAHVARDAGARREADDEHHHQRPAAHAGDRRSAESLTGSAAPRSRWTGTSRRTTACARCAAARAPSTASSRTSASVIGKTRISIGGNFDESSADSFSGPARLPQGAGFRRQARQGQFQAGGPRREPAKPKGMLVAHSGGRQRQAARRLVHDGCRGRRRLDLRQLLVPRREDGPAPRGDPAPRVLDLRRRARGSLPRAPQQRPHDRPRRIALRLPGLHRRERALDRPHRRQHRSVAGTESQTLRHARPVEGLRGLRLHPGVRGGVPDGFIRTAWRHERADMSQSQLRIGGPGAGT